MCVNHALPELLSGVVFTLLCLMPLCRRTIDALDLWRLVHSLPLLLLCRLAEGRPVVLCGSGLSGALAELAALAINWVVRSCDDVYSVGFSAPAFMNEPMREHLVRQVEEAPEERVVCGRMRNVVVGGVEPRRPNGFVHCASLATPHEHELYVVKEGARIAPGPRHFRLYISVRSSGCSS